MRLEVHRRPCVFTCLCTGFALQGCFLMWGIPCQMFRSAGNEQLGVFLLGFVRVLGLKTHLSSKRSTPADVVGGNPPAN